MWRGHNREYILGSNEDKSCYLDKLAKTYRKKIKENIFWHSYCLMGNHTHETSSMNPEKETKENVTALGNWMRDAHSQFGRAYNDKYKRCGRVAYDRPKTVGIDHDMQLLQTMFYGDANPVKAGMVSHPSRYRFSSYMFYAYGKKNRHTKHLVPPKAYFALGKTPQIRQKKYRQFCDMYLRANGLLDNRPSEDVEEMQSEDFLGLILKLLMENGGARGDP